MCHQALHSVAKIALLIFLLSLSNAAYAQDGQKQWKHGWGIHNVSILSQSEGEFKFSSANLQVLQYRPRLEMTRWSLHLGIGTGIADDDFYVTNVSNNAVYRHDLELDYYASVALLARVTSTFSLGPAYARARTTASSSGRAVRHKASEVGLALSNHSKNRRHAFEVIIAGEASTLGYRWSR